MKSILLNEQGDFVFKQGSFLMVEGDEELAQSVKVILQTAKDEWFLDEDFGLNREPLFSKRTNENEIRDSIIEALIVEPRISAVENISFRKENRVLFVDLTLRKQDGEILQVGGVDINAR
ncbi:MAG: DUF2634 domain-containing protein [Bacillota bacterium]